ncbi:protein phosphatase slingshot [Plakobranchus ocellatus]|uniref:protein-serine/threonine phosphatase n=1 Tax=Plakobranchus ocellatus TaxID=259542 RepID=A0AAV3Y3E0_9GAST|nr:protein phosphatase slingshot [Plakobranchus ocellatus]
MALVTIQRSPSPSTDDNDGAESSEDLSDGKTQLRKRSRTPREKLRHIFSTVRLINKLRPGLSESYFTVKGAALILPHNECTRKTSKKSHGGEMQHHLQAMLHILRPEDTIKIAIRLEDVVNNYHRYIALVSTKGRQDTEECVILGLDCSSTGASIGLVLPVWLGLKLKLGGDGGFSLYTDEHSYLFKPVSVQAMWSAIQSLVKAISTAEMMKYIHDGLTHTWVGYYKSRINHSDNIRMGQWKIEGIDTFAPSSLSIKSDEKIEGIDTFAPSSLSIKSDDEKKCIKLTISQKLKEVMMVVDLDEATSIGLRRAVEAKMGISLTEFKSYFDEEVMRILGQMDEPSEILDFLYLGSEWNASNLEELKAKGVGYILNVTKEIDNFFMGMLQYYTVRVMDVEESDLLKHWDKTYKFICKARNNNSKVLVHCKMGISRSASTVMAFLMKDRRWSVDEAFTFVKARRSCVQPNAGFMEQLNMYEGILTASNKRDIFRSKSDQNLLDEPNPKEETETVQGSFLGDSLFHVMSHSDWPMLAAGGVAPEEEWMADLQAGRGMTPELMQMEGDLEVAEARSADSMDDVVADEPKNCSVTPDPTPHGLVSGDVEHPHKQSTGEDFSTSSSAREEKSSSAPPALESAVDGGGGQGQVPIASSRSIKPDSSWIRPLSLDLGPDAGESSTDDPPTAATCQSLPCTPAPLPPGAALGSGQQLEQPAQLESTGAGFTLLGATENESTDSVMQVEPGTAARPRRQELSAVGGSSTDRIQSTVLAEQSEGDKSDSNSQRLSGGEADTSSGSSRAQTLAQSDVGVSASDSGQKSSSAGDDNCATTSPKSTVIKPKIEMGVRQYFFREKIPWSPGKVQKMREGINKTGQLVADDETEEGVSSETEQDKVAQSSGEGLDLQKGCVSGTATLTLPGMSQSRSCMELGSMAGADGCTGELMDSLEPMSLYEREEIPLEPGTVLRTRKEIEERHRFLIGQADGEDEEKQPLVRTSSLKQSRTTSKYDMGDNIRRSEGSLILSPGSGMSLDDLRRVGNGEIQSMHPRGPPSFSVAEQSLVNPGALSCPGQARDSGADGEFPSSIPKSNLDTETLALIREIGSALLMSPTSSSPSPSASTQAVKQSEAKPGPDSNMVKYFVRKIEQQQHPLVPSPCSEETQITGSVERNGDISRVCELQSSSPDSVGVECLIKPRSSSLQESHYAVTFSSGGDPSQTTGSQETKMSTLSGSLETIKSGLGSEKELPHSNFSHHCKDEVFSGAGAKDTVNATGHREEEDQPSVDASLPQTSAEVEMPMVKHLVGKFESGPDFVQAADILSTSVAASGLGEQNKKTSEHCDQSNSFLHPKSDSSPVLSKVLAPSSSPSSSSSSPISHFTDTQTSASACRQVKVGLSQSVPMSSAPAQTSKRSMIDFDIPVELVELPRCVPEQSEEHQQQQSTMAISPQTSPPSSARALGPRPFSKQNLVEMFGECRTWRSVRPKSVPDQHVALPGTGHRNSSNQHHRTASADFSLQSIQERYAGKSGEEDPIMRQGSGEEGRKKRRLHGKSLPLPAAIRAGEQQQQQQDQQQKSRLGQGPFYSSI